MSRVLYTGAVADFKGSIAGTTFQKNTSGSIARSKPARRFTSSLLQYNSQALFISLSQRWQSLDLADQLDWNVFAAAHSKYNYFNEEKTLTGYNYFISINANLFLSSMALIDVPPVYTLPPAIPSYTLDFDSSDFEIVFDATFNHAGNSIFVFSTPFIRSSALYNRKQLRLIKIVPSNSTDTIDIAAAHSNYFNYNYPPSGNSIFVLIALASVHNTSGLASIFSLSNHQYT